VLGRATYLVLMAACVAVTLPLELVLEYTAASALGVVLAALLELLVPRTGLFRDPRSMAGPSAASRVELACASWMSCSSICVRNRPRLTTCS
jgi:hypothetical protein